MTRAANNPRRATVRGALLAVVGVALLLGACAQDERTVRYKPFFSGLEGVETQTPPVYDNGHALVEADRGKAAPATAPGEDELVVKTKDGRKFLIARSGVQLMHHIQTQLQGDDAELFANQVLCEATRQEFRERGIDPKQAFVALKVREREIAKLFARMPMGEHSPSVLMETLGGNVFRVKLTGAAAKGLEGWTGFDMVLEKGNYRLRWFL